MMSLAVVFWMYVILFAVIGGMRGWAKEIMVSFSVILALAFIALLEHYVPFIRDVLLPQQSTTLFWLRTIILIMLVFFGYQTVNFQRFAGKMNREKLEHAILGIVIGAAQWISDCRDDLVLYVRCQVSFSKYRFCSSREHCNDGE